MAPKGHRASARHKTNPPDHREGSLSIRSRAGSNAGTEFNDTVMGDAHYFAQDSGYMSPPGGRSFPSQDIVTQSSNGLIEAFGHGLKKLMTVINRLEALGIDNSFAIPLPKIVVIGDQSAGKSSQIAALSEINVPRAGGTCTRCVLHISLRNNEQADAGWRCRVSLLKKYDLFDSMNISGPFSPWQLKALPEVIPFMDLNSKDQLEEAMARAQLALLNPKRSPADFLRVSQVPANQAEFSPNEVHLEIESQSLPNLTFYDLPGIINEDGNEVNNMPDLVRALATEYMNQQNTIIMLARAMESDPQTSSAGRLVRELGAAYRTIGVLTKPDRLESGANVNQWDDILSGRTFRAEHGYFVTKQPTQAQLDGHIDHTKARKDEAEFFANQAPWNTTLKRHEPRFGTGKLSERLSMLLEREIQTSLPAITEAVEIKSQDIEARLQALPEAPPENCLGLIYGFLESLRTSIKRHMLGELPENAFVSELPEKSFVNECRDFARELRNTLVMIKPTVIVMTPPEPNWMTGDATIEIKSDDDEQTDMPTTNGSQKRQMAAPITPSKRQRSAQPRQTPTRRIGSWTPKQFSLQKIKDKLSSLSNSGVPNQVDPLAETHFIVQSQADWHKIIAEYVQKIAEQLQLKIKTILQKELEKWSETMLSSETYRIVWAFLTKILGDYRDYTARAIKAELLKPTTTNEEIYNRYREQELATIKTARFKKRARSFASFREEKYGEKLLDRHGNPSKVTQEQLGEDPFELQIQVMARVRAYYLVAVDYVADHMAKATKFELYHRCSMELVNDLEQALDISSTGASNNAKKLLAENPEREEERSRLRNQRLQLEQARQTLASLHVGPHVS